MRDDDFLGDTARAGEAGRILAFIVVVVGLIIYGLCRWLFS